ncbi:MAG: hypothetical protein F4Z31_02115 [Gemmatimonadetes bacterium]|nr:hypothetical protein [Gemmatimonadota bacterium]
MTRPVWVTKVLRPGPARVSQIGQMQLSRSVPLPGLLAGGGGALAGVLFMMPALAIGLPALQSVVFGLAAGGTLGVVAVTWGPWREESLLRAASVRLAGARGRTETVCPGTGDEPGLDADSHEPVCMSCMKRLDPDDDGLVPEHPWSRQVSIGCLTMSDPEIGETLWVVGSVPVRARE